MKKMLKRINMVFSFEDLDARIKVKTVLNLDLRFTKYFINKNKSKK
jgi:hypothetical protein